MIDELSTGYVDIYYADLMNSISSLNRDGFWEETIGGFGSSGDLMKDTQLVQSDAYSFCLQNNFNNIVKNIAYDKISERNIEITQDIIDYIDNEINDIDHNDSVEEVREYVDDVITSMENELNINLEVVVDKEQSR